MFVSLFGKLRSMLEGLEKKDKQDKLNSTLSLGSQGLEIDGTGTLLLFFPVILAV